MDYQNLTWFSTQLSELRKNIAFAVSEAKLATPYTTNTTTRQDTTPYTTNTTTVFHFKVQNVGTEIFISNE